VLVREHPKHLRKHLAAKVKNKKTTKNPCVSKTLTTRKARTTNDEGGNCVGKSVDARKVGISKKNSLASTKSGSNWVAGEGSRSCWEKRKEVTQRKGGGITTGRTRHVYAETQ